MKFQVTVEFDSAEDAQAFANDVETYNNVTVSEDNIELPATFVEVKEVAENDSLV